MEAIALKTVELDVATTIDESPLTPMELDMLDGGQPVLNFF